MEFNFPRDYFSKDYFMCFANFSVFLYFDFSISAKIDSHKIIKTSPSTKKKKKERISIRKNRSTQIFAKIHFCEDLSPYVCICCQCVIIFFSFWKKLRVHIIP